MTIFSRLFLPLCPSGIGREASFPAAAVLEFFARPFCKKAASPRRSALLLLPLLHRLVVKTIPHGSAPCLCRLGARSAPPGTPAALLLQLPRVARTRLLPRPSPGFCLPPARPPPGPWWRRTLFGGDIRLPAGFVRLFANLSATALCAGRPRPPCKSRKRPPAAAEPEGFSPGLFSKRPPARAAAPCFCRRFCTALL